MTSIASNYPLLSGGDMFEDSQLNRMCMSVRDCHAKRSSTTDTASAAPRPRLPPPLRRKARNTSEQTTHLACALQTYHTQQSQCMRQAKILPARSTSAHVINQHTETKSNMPREQRDTSSTRVSQTTTYSVLVHVQSCRNLSGDAVSDVLLSES